MMLYEYMRHEGGINYFQIDGIGYNRAPKDTFEVGNARYYVVVKDENGRFHTPDAERVELVSFNPGGEIRWRVCPVTADEDDRKAIEHFDLAGPVKEI